MGTTLPLSADINILSMTGLRALGCRSIRIHAFVIRIVLPAPLSDALRNVYLSFAMHVMTLLPMIHRGIGGLGIASARYTRSVV